MTTTHPFLDDKNYAKLKEFARVMHEQGGMEALSNDGEILLHMAMNGLPNPTMNAGEHYKVILFSDTKHAWLVVMFSGFTDEGGNGLAALRVNREYLTKQFCLTGSYSPHRANIILASMLAILHVDARNVEIPNLGKWQGSAIITRNN